MIPVTTDPAINNTISFDMSASWKLFLIISVFTTIFLLSVCGNGIMMWIILSQKSMRNSTNFFLVNLSASNILMAVTHIFPNIYYCINNQWIFGLTLCKLSQFIMAFSVSVTVLTFIGMAADRFTVIMYPLRTRPSSKMILVSIVVIWLIAIASGLFGGIEAKIVVDNNRYICDFLPDGDWKLKYDISLLILQYVLPLFVLTVTYIPISIRLWKSRTIGEQNQSQRENMKTKRKLVKMLISIIIIFAVCWLPYQCFFVIIDLHKNLNDDPNLLIVFFVVYALAMSYSFTNPVISCIMSKRFRTGFKSFFRWCPFITWPISQSDNETQTQRSEYFRNVNDHGANGTQRLLVDGEQNVITNNVTVL